MQSSAQIYSISITEVFEWQYIDVDVMMQWSAYLAVILEDPGLDPNPDLDAHLLVKRSKRIHSRFSRSFTARGVSSRDPTRV